MRCGRFEDSAREYVITDPCTPTKWINYVGTLAFGGFVDHTGGALLCRGDPATNRITRYISLQPAGEFRGTTLYLRSRESGGWKTLAPFFVPCLAPLDSFECHVGLGYSRIVSVLDGIRTDAAFFVPLQDSRLVGGHIPRIGNRPAGIYLGLELAGRNLAHALEILLRQGKQPLFDQLRVQLIAQGQEVVSIQAGISQHRGGQRAAAPVGALVALVEVEAKLVRQHIPQPNILAAQNPRTQHRVKEVGETEAKVALQTQNVILSGMKNLLDGGIFEDRA